MLPPQSLCGKETHNTKKEDPMAWTQAEIETCIENCKKKAAVDADFRKKLLVDPVAAVKEISGKEVPAGFKIKVLENDPSYDATFVLPPLVSGNISDSELDDVTAGICGLLSCGMKACATEGNGSK